MVSKATAGLDHEFNIWRNRPIGEIVVVYLDATYVKTRVDGNVVNMPVMTAIGVLITP